MKKYLFLETIFKNAPFHSILYLVIDVLGYLLTYWEIRIIQGITNCVTVNNYYGFLYFSITLSVVYILQSLKPNLLQYFENFIQLKVTNVEYKNLCSSIQKMKITDLDDIHCLMEIEQAKKAIESQIIESFHMFSSSIGIVFGIIAVSVSLNKIGRVYLLCFIFMVAFQKIYNINSTKAKVKMELETNPLLRIHRYFRDIIAIKDMAKEIRSYQLYEWIEKKRTEVYEHVQKKQLVESKKWVLINAVVSIVMFSTECIIYCYMIHQYYGGKITIDQIVYIIQSNSIFIECFMLLFENHTNLSVNTIYFQSLQNIKKYNKEVNKHVQQCKDDNNCIEMEDISYSYKKTLGYAINNINVEIKKGEKIALLGENGCGKSTFIKIITSLIEPDTGSIRASQKQSVVFQDFAKFKLKLSENIFIGELKKKDDTEAIIDALEKSGGTGMLARLPYGIESELNKEFNTYGVDLSGGEWQKIGISRGLFRLANVIVLDEPTASLDPLAEVKEFEKLLTGSLKNQTVIIVSHRASVAKKVDRILFMKDGEIVEDGSFKQLINLKGKFYDFYKIQAKWYK